MTVCITTGTDTVPKPRSFCFLSKVNSLCYLNKSSSHLLVVIVMYIYLCPNQFKDLLGKADLKSKVFAMALLDKKPL